MLSQVQILRNAEIFEALGHETRLKVFLFIYQSGKKGARPKEMIDEFGVDSGTLDFHLKKLVAVRLIALKEGCPRGTYCPNEHLPLDLALLMPAGAVARPSVQEN
ncbi:helix-turn-helix transcriptional regulator [Polynucleobacter sp. Latsch14-2]|jgi:DNA-binding transcriptional ArsR family regulator|uniref:winged helix-turn-helix domain-containing protein n=1 Tax=Polynucleobacter sp. Latsch14-2 TaxID=2576920 RepID=UPI001C0DAB80|nr:helix-turn-helix domain-containing protein [Polynucleobacter sp. Latsch14-2]MBU3614226.1 helix-turn-helix transcriptional regulator [Polynucleobacter sp. Latsch14-2]